MTESEALTLAIFAINTLLHPDASTQADVDAVDARGGEAIKVLVRMRGSQQEGQ